MKKTIVWILIIIVVLFPFVNRLCWTNLLKEKASDETIKSSLIGCKIEDEGKLYIVTSDNIDNFTCEKTPKYALFNSNKHIDVSFSFDIREQHFTGDGSLYYYKSTMSNGYYGWYYQKFNVDGCNSSFYLK